MRLDAGLITDEEFAAIQAAKTYFSSGFRSKNHDPKCTTKHPHILFAFWQEDGRGGKAPYWHVMNEGRSHHSTLSMQGLHDWEVLR